MKKIILIIAVAISINVMGKDTIVPNKIQTKDIYDLTIATEQIYWEGAASNSGENIYLKVYRTIGQCDSFYAIATGYKSHWSNKSWSSISTGRMTVHQRSKGGYYVRYDNRDWIFHM